MPVPFFALWSWLESPSWELGANALRRGTVYCHVCKHNSVSPLLQGSLNAVAICDEGEGLGMVGCWRGLDPCAAREDCRQALGYVPRADCTASAPRGCPTLNVQLAIHQTWVPTPLSAHPAHTALASGKKGDGIELVCRKTANDEPVGLLGSSRVQERLHGVAIEVQRIAETRKEAMRTCLPPPQLEMWLVARSVWCELPKLLTTDSLRVSPRTHTCVPILKRATNSSLPRLEW